MKIIGNGTIVEVKPGKVYRLRHCMGKDPVTGKYVKSPWKTVYCNKRQARDELARYKQELLSAVENQNQLERYTSPTIAEYAAQYLAIRESVKTLASSTLMRDKCDLKHVLKVFGNCRMDEITPQMINARCAWYRRVEGVSLNVISRMAKMLKTLYRKAVRDGIVEHWKNPCLGIDVDKPDPSERKSLSVDEYARLASILENEPLDGRIVAVRLGMSTGMRKGEVLGLDWENVDLASFKISVVKQYTPSKRIAKPKSKAGFRVLSIDRSTAEFLGKWQKRQRAILLMRGVEVNSQTPVASSSNGQRLDPSSFAKWFRAFCVEHGFGRFRTTEVYRDGQGSNGGWKRLRKTGYEGLRFHELRHTQATLLIGSNCDIKTVQHRLGHSDVQTTLNIYAHVIEANDEEAAEIIGRLQSQTE